MTKLNASIAQLPMPVRLRARPISDKGFPVPWFVAWIDGKPDFRVVAAEKVPRAVNLKLCWLCGEKLGGFLAFVIGPMCAVNRVSSEPPSHRDCAEYAVRACPFLAQPRMRRNEKDMPADGYNPGGVMIGRNPGVTIIWITRTYTQFRDGARGRLFKIGAPVSIHCYAEGRQATAEEVETSVATGLPLLQDIARKQGGEAVRDLQLQVRLARRLLGLTEAA